MISNEIGQTYVRDQEQVLIKYGTVKAFPENDTMHELFRTDVSVYYSYYEPELCCSTPSLYLCREHGKLQIEQLPPEDFTTEPEEEQKID